MICDDKRCGGMLIFVFVVVFLDFDVFFNRVGLLVFFFLFNPGARPYLGVLLFGMGGGGYGSQGPRAHGAILNRVPAGPPLCVP